MYWILGEFYFIVGKSNDKCYTGTCGGAIKLSLTPIKSKNGDHGRFFQKTIMSIGFPKYYETRTRCLWTLEVNDFILCKVGRITFLYFSTLINL